MVLAVFYALLKEPLGAKNVEFSRRLSCFYLPDLQSAALAVLLSLTVNRPTPTGT
jgi:hypothetical protein